MDIIHALSWIFRLWFDDYRFVNDWEDWNYLLQWIIFLKEGIPKTYLVQRSPKMEKIPQKSHIKIESDSRGNKYIFGYLSERGSDWQW